MTISLARRVASFKFEQEVSSDAADRRARYSALTGQRAGWIGNAIDRITPNAASFIQHDDVNIDFPPFLVGKHEIPFRYDLAKVFTVSQLRHPAPKRGQKLVLNGNIEIIV